MSDKLLKEVLKILSVIRTIFSEAEIHSQSIGNVQKELIWVCTEINRAPPNYRSSIMMKSEQRDIFVIDIIAIHARIRKECVTDNLVSLVSESPEKLRAQQVVENILKWWHLLPHEIESEEWFAKQITSWIRNEPLKARVQIYMDGLYYHQPIELNPGVLRPFEAKDSPPQTPQIFGQGNNLNKSQMVLEVEIDFFNTERFGYDVEKLLSTCKILISPTVRSIGRFARAPGNLDNPLGPNSYSLDTAFEQETKVLTAQDVELIKNNFWNLHHYLPWRIGSEIEANNSFLGIALMHYSEAGVRGVMNDISEQFRISMCVLALEALLLKENREMQLRVRLRAEKMVAAVDGNTNKIQSILSNAYKVRNAFAHGSMLTNEVSGLESDIGMNLSILRRSLYSLIRWIFLAVVFIQKDKHDLTLIDQALTSETANRTLKSKLNLLPNSVRSIPLDNNWLQF